MALTDEDKAWIRSTMSKLLAPTNERLDALTRYILEMRSEVIRRSDGLEQRQDFMTNALLNYQPLNKAMLDR
jgi:hypothetical protein